MDALAITLAAFLAIAIASLALSVRITLRDRERNADQQSRDAQIIKELTSRLATTQTETKPKIVQLYAQGTLGPYEIEQSSYIDTGERLVEKLNSELFDTLKNSGLIETTIRDDKHGGKTITQKLHALRPDWKTTP